MRHLPVPSARAKDIVISVGMPLISKARQNSILAIHLSWAARQLRPHAQTFATTNSNRLKIEK
jgi:hypothetical protein